MAWTKSSYYCFTCLSFLSITLFRKFFMNLCTSMSTFALNYSSLDPPAFPRKNLASALLFYALILYDFNSACLWALSFNSYITNAALSWMFCIYSLASRPFSMFLCNSLSLRSSSKLVSITSSYKSFAFSGYCLKLLTV